MPELKKVDVHTDEPKKSAETTPSKRIDATKSLDKNELSDDEEDYYNDYSDYYEDDEKATKTADSIKKTAPVTKTADKDIKLRPIEKTKVLHAVIFSHSCVCTARASIGRQTRTR